MGEQQASGGGRIELESLSKWYGAQQVLNSIDLVIEPGVHVALDINGLNTEGLSGVTTVLVRPERLLLVPPSEGHVRAAVDHVVFAGAATHVHLRVGDQALQAVVPNNGSPLAAVEGGEVGLLLQPDALRVLPD